MWRLFFFRRSVSSFQSIGFAMFDDSMLHFPDSYTIKKRVNGGDWIDHVLRVDPYGNIGLDMNSNENIEYMVPEGMEILCNIFSVSTSSAD